MLQKKRMPIFRKTGCSVLFLRAAKNKIGIKGNNKKAMVASYTAPLAKQEKDNKTAKQMAAMSSCFRLSESMALSIIFFILLIY